MHYWKWVSDNNGGQPIGTITGWNRIRINYQGLSQNQNMNNEFLSLLLYVKVSFEHGYLVEGGLYYLSN